MLLAREGGPEPAPPRDAMVKTMDTEGFNAMCEEANYCPACILAALRTKNSFDPEEGHQVAGPQDGREAWSYRTAKEDFWKCIRSTQVDRE
jgi:hypothetical protein